MQCLILISAQPSYGEGCCNEIDWPKCLRIRSVSVADAVCRLIADREGEQQCLSVFRELEWLWRKLCSHSKSSCQMWSCLAESHNSCRSVWANVCSTGLCAFRATSATQTTWMASCTTFPSETPACLWTAPCRVERVSTATFLFCSGNFIEVLHFLTEWQKLLQTLYLLCVSLPPSSGMMAWITVRRTSLWTTTRPSSRKLKSTCTVFFTSTASGSV